MTVDDLWLQMLIWRLNHVLQGAELEPFVKDDGHHDQQQDHTKATTVDSIRPSGRVIGLGPVAVNVSCDNGAQNPGEGSCRVEPTHDHLLVGCSDAGIVLLPNLVNMDLCNRKIANRITCTDDDQESDVLLLRCAWLQHQAVCDKHENQASEKATVAWHFVGKAKREHDADDPSHHEGEVRDGDVKGVPTEELCAEWAVGHLNPHDEVVAKEVDHQDHRCRKYIWQG